MKIKYKKKRFIIYISVGFLCVVLGLISIYKSINFLLFNSSYLIFGIMYLGIALYEWKNQYLLIDETSIKQNHFFGKKMEFSEIKSIRNFAGEYTLKGVKKEMLINTEIIEEDSLIELKELFKKLDVPAYKKS